MQYNSGPLSLNDKCELLNNFATSCNQADISWSLSLGAENEILAVERRLTLYGEATPGLIIRLTRLAKDLGMGAEAIAAWRENLAHCDAVFFTISSDFKSLRLYAQELDRHLDRVEAGDLSPFTLYRGFKSLPEGHYRQDDYICRPLVDIARIEAGVSEILGAAAADFVANLQSAKVIWAEISAQERQSWLLTLREMELPPHLSAAAFAKITAPVGDLAQAMQSRQLLHLAAGRDGLKGRFASFYLAAEAGDISSFLHSARERI